MAAKKQLFAYCEKQFKVLRLPYFSGYQQFLESYFSHYVENPSVNDLGYYADVSIAHFKQVMDHRVDGVSIDISNISVQKEYVHNFTRILMCFPDQPFVVESIRQVLNNLECQIRKNNLMANFSIEKTARKLDFIPVEEGGVSFIWMDVENHGGVNNDDIKSALQSVLNDIDLVVQDWRHMQDTMRSIMHSWRKTPKTVVSEKNLDVYIAFVEWILQYFTFLGYQGYRYSGKKKVPLKDKWGLSTKKDAVSYNLNIENFPKQLSDETSPLLLMTQTADRSTIHRDVYKDMIVLRVYCANKKHWIEEHYFSGLLTADAYATEPTSIPLLNQKFKEALAIPQLRGRYSLKRMAYILKYMPREELFRSDVASLSHAAYQTLLIQGTRTAKMFVRRDVCQQYYSVMLYIPKNILTTKLRLKIEACLMHYCRGRDIQYSPVMTDDILTRLYFTVQVDPLDTEAILLKEMEEAVGKLCVSWEDGLYEGLCRSFGQKKGFELSKKYTQGLSSQYQSTYNADTAILDIALLEALTEEQRLELRVDVEHELVHFKLCQLSIGETVSLKQVFPLLSNYGFDVKSEQHFEENIGENVFHISEYACHIKHQSIVDIHEIKEELRQAVLNALTEKDMSDALSGLMVIAGIRLQEINVIRALCTYLHQIKFPLSVVRISVFFLEYPKFAQSLIRYFNAKFQPKIVKRDAFLKRYHKELSAFTESVQTSDDERIVRELTTVLGAIVRTNYCLKGRETITFKIASSKIDSIPKPAPLYEFFVFSQRVMGVHLRFSKVARGGIRNSDRLDDVRHEVFELAKTQRLKNTLIVPDGAKGGFVCKRPIVDGEVLACYQIFIRSMLSLTDNDQNGKIVRDPKLVIYDDDDPYFVVAADKGTATFSSYANAISLEHHYWLGDAFASGGEHGYDHKKMGITAKGAWESVKWHFLGKGLNVYKTPFSAVGIGDMSGDVFGNGMLLSDQLRLVAAFNFDTIFIDPTPNEKLSYQERLRLFKLPRSNWMDYNATKISQGGGVFLRSEKYILLTPQMKKLFSTSKLKMEPTELIREILKLPVDLIWNGGIGVYVKSSRETDYEVSDFHNDACRIDACDLKASIVGEGGNNGFTQLGRIEYSQAGGLINTDFIDNSAGVNTSDIEVNFKILFQGMIAKKEMNLSKRNHLLAKLSHHVSEQVLRNNFLQNVQINLTLIDARKHPDNYIQLIESLEAIDLLNRDIEKIPSKKELELRKKQLDILTRPEVSVLLSYSKIALYQAIVPLELGKHALTEIFLLNYFPKALSQAYASSVKKHHLRDELVATELTNHMIGEVGMLFMPQLCDECNVSPDQVVMSYLVVRKSLDLERIYEMLYATANTIDQVTFLYLLGSLQRAIYRSCRYLIRYQDMSKPKKLLASFEKVASLPFLLERFPKKYSYRMYKIQKILIEAGLNEVDAQLICESRYFYQRFGIQHVVNVSGFLPTQVVNLYYQIAQSTGFHKVKEKLAAVDVKSRWDTIQKSSIDDELGNVLELLTQVVLRYADKHQQPPQKALDAWAKEYHQVNKDIRNAFNEIIEPDKIDLSIFLVMLGRVKRYLNNV